MGEEEVGKVPSGEVGLGQAQRQEQVREVGPLKEPREVQICPVYNPFSFPRPYPTCSLALKLSLKVFPYKLVPVRTTLPVWGEDIWDKMKQKCLDRSELIISSGGGCCFDIKKIRPYVGIRC